MKEEIIEKAIIGGWKPKHVGVWSKCKNPKEVLETFLFCYPDDESIRQHGHMYEYVCDPLFWKALGKACRVICGEHTKKGYCVNCDNQKYHYPIGIHTGMRFHEINLRDGFDKAIEFIKKEIEQFYGRGK